MTNSPKTPNEVSVDTANHRSRTYERPDFPYRCGRERLWSSPCGRGPNADGTCGGISECLPTRRGDRWHCSRPIWAGGPCTHGPKPDGSCYTQRPPCRPQASARIKRHRASLFAVVASVAIIAGLFATSSGILGFDRNLTIPGPLTAAHANLIDGKRCVLCHEGHERQGLTLAKALVEHQDISRQCSQCHGFDGHSSKPHNAPLTGDQTPADVSCIGCHTEHKGAIANISILPDADCHGCHEPNVRFQEFVDKGSGSHPPFSDSFGKLDISSIRFDHAKHFETHFKKPQHQEHRPKSCTTCHQRAETRGELDIPSFEEGCASCHEGKIKDQPMLLLTWPEMETMDPPGAQAIDHCRIDELFNLDDFESTSLELPGLIEAFFMDVDPDDMTDYGDAYQKLGNLLAIEGVRPLADLVQDKGGDPARLLAGLAPEIIANPACNWIANQEYEGPEPLGTSGWTAEPLGLSYHPIGHADPVLRAWLEFGGEIGSSGADELSTSALKAALFDPESGPGLCASCHQAPATGEMIWRSESQSRRHTVFDHEPHLAIEQAKGVKLCTTCHELGPTDSEEQGYENIGLQTCQQCHGQRWVGASCATCHRYHPAR